MPQNLFDKKKTIDKDSLAMRKRAEDLFRAQPISIQDIKLADIPDLLQELQIHQFELTLQNEELQTARLQLEESWARYVYLYDHAPVGYFTFDDKGRILEVNHTGSEQLGLNTEDLLNKPFSFCLSQDDSDVFYLHLKKVFSTQSRQTCTLTPFENQDRQFHVQLDSIPSIDCTKEHLCCQTSVTDITERKRLEETLQASETLFRSLFEEAREGILIVDVETGQISDINPFLMEMLGYSREDISDKKIWEIGILQNIKAWKNTISELQSKGSVHYINIPLTTRSGRHIVVEFTSSVFTVNEQQVMQCRIRNTSSPPLDSDSSSYAHDGTERRMWERRDDLRKNVEQIAEERIRHRQTEEALVKATAEIKTLQERLVSENIYFQPKTTTKHTFTNIIGQSKRLKQVLYRVEQVAPIDTTVLILGETGTGKALIAAAIHSLSSRRNRPMIAVNCAALPPSLIESELFGREKGAFTGADTRQTGRFETADGSTLCLDEIGELAPELQAKLLHVVQHGEFERLGSSKTINVDVRLLAMTNRNLEEAIHDGSFRQDLYYRLNIFPITVPPLRQRKDDIPLLVQAFVEKFAKKMGKQITSIPKETMKRLQDYPWPGNIRELESIIQRAVILSPGAVLLLEDRPDFSPFAETASGKTMKEIEYNQILKVLTETQWRIEGTGGAAMLLDIHPSTLRARMQKLGISRPEQIESD
ncbi:sigma 54-interacting transcriptional regulator [Desulfopila sp. IMCC35008]|uniref:sigma 54-interacting transcriptional regulator n=1 Tax=Desulfopila sp. IMCC35008 TaxID=2653858 RepID=UPI0013D05654|nr:sigma 54-interacting transcriptional regulator [Desulfopila sp. IMCC35008]